MQVRLVSSTLSTGILSEPNYELQSLIVLKDFVFAVPYRHLRGKKMIVIHERMPRLHSRKVLLAIVYSPDGTLLAVSVCTAYGAYADLLG